MSCHRDSPWMHAAQPAQTRFRRRVSPPFRVRRLAHISAVRADSRRTFSIKSDHTEATDRLTWSRLSSTPTITVYRHSHSVAWPARRRLTWRTPGQRIWQTTLPIAVTHRRTHLTTAWIAAARPSIDDMSSLRITFTIYRSSASARIWLETFSVGGKFPVS